MFRKKIYLIPVLSVLLLVLVIAAGCDVFNSNGTINKSTDTTGTKPIFSDLGGVFTGTMTLEMSLPDEFADSGYDICYTLNNSIPDWLSESYKDPIELPCNESIETEFGDEKYDINVTIVRAACFDSNGEIVGEVQTATYIQVPDKDRFSMPVVSLVTEDENLYDKKFGIMAPGNTSNKGKEWERPVHVSFIETNGKLAISQDAGIRLFGNSSRGLAQKSLRITARKPSYFDSDIFSGGGKFYHNLFPGRLDGNGNELAVYDSFILRNGGNDSFFSGTEGHRSTFMRDGLAYIIGSKASEHVDGMAYRPVVVLLNGEYYGVLNMRERNDEHFIENMYGIEDTDNITMISNELDTSLGGRYDGMWFYYVLDNGRETELDALRNFFDDILHGLYTYEEASKYIDMENVMEYYAINLFICNTDWPHNNLRIWRYTGKYDPENEMTDGKWRFMFKDQDLSMSRYTVGSNHGMPVELYNAADASNFKFTLVNYIDFGKSNGLPSISDEKYPDSLYTQGLFHFCLQNDGFRKAFYDYCVKLATEIWPADKLTSQIEKSYKAIKNEMKLAMFEKSFGEHFWEADLNYAEWTEASIGDSRHSLLYWAKNRTGEDGYFLQYLDDIMEYYE